MQGLFRACVGVAVVSLGSWYAELSVAQEPVPEGLSTPQGTALPPMPGGIPGSSAPGGQGQPGGGGGGGPGSGTPDSSANPFGSSPGTNPVPGDGSSAFGSNPGSGGGGGTSPIGSDGGATSSAGASPGLGGSGGTPSGAPGIIGDIAPTVAIRSVSGVPQPPPIPPPNQPSAPGLPGPKFRSQLAPSVRGFKIAENQSPFPQDRVFFTFNFFNDVNGKLDRYFSSPIDHLNVYRYVFGYEKTFNDGKGSIGIRMPLNTIHADTSAGLINTGGQSTAVGNVTIFAKYILEYNPKTGNLLTAGLAVTPPTGPGRFAGARFLGGSNNTTIQPFLGYFVNLTESKKLFLQGFTALDVPVDFTDVTLVYNDLGLGYFAYRNPDTFISAVVPTVEVHINTPLNHRAEYSLRDPSGTAASVNITSGMNIEVKRNSLFTIGVVAPTTGPRPFNVEAIALFNYRFGSPRRPRPTPIIGG